MGGWLEGITNKQNLWGQNRMRRTTRAKARPEARERQDKADERRQQIIGGALACFKRTGYHETSILEIAAKAGVSSGLLYQYFKDKQDILFHVIVDILDEYSTYVRQSFLDIKNPVLFLQSVSIAYFKVIENKSYTSLLAYSEWKSLTAEQITFMHKREIENNQPILDAVTACKEAGLLLDLDPEIITYNITMAAQTWSLKAWRLKKIATFDKYARDSLFIIINGILNERGHALWAEENLLDGRAL
jgi:AcrR family transcriptional regulator